MLKDKVVAVPESRQDDILVKLLENRGARVRRVPMVAIRDNPDQVAVSAWIEGFVNAPPDDFIILTGEGLRRLLAAAERIGLKGDFLRILPAVRTICRGPKPERVLRDLGLKAQIQALAPTTEGVIASLDTMALTGRRIAVQLYGTDPNLRLMDYLGDRGADTYPVAPYIYEDRVVEEEVLSLIQSLAAGQIDVIAFTSKPQFKRLQTVALKQGLETCLREGLGKTRVAAVGPVVKDQLEAAGVHVSIMPARAFFMKPLVTAIVKFFAGAP